MCMFCLAMVPILASCEVSSFGFPGPDFRNYARVVACRGSLGRVTGRSGMYCTVLYNRHSSHVCPSSIWRYVGSNSLLCIISGYSACILISFWSSSRWLAILLFSFFWSWMLSSFPIVRVLFNCLTTRYTPLLQSYHTLALKLSTLSLFAIPYIYYGQCNKTYWCTHNVVCPSVRALYLINYNSIAVGMQRCVWRSPAMIAFR